MNGTILQQKDDYQLFVDMLITMFLPLLQYKNHSYLVQNEARTSFSMSIISIGQIGALQHNIIPNYKA